jgi:hypothetical protein
LPKFRKGFNRIKSKNGKASVKKKGKILEKVIIRKGTRRTKITKINSYIILPVG